MKLKQHIDINWERWIRPCIGSTTSREPLERATLKAVTYSPRAEGNPDQVALQLEQGGKSIIVHHVFSDARFARWLRQELQAHCLNMTLHEIGERNAP